MNYLAHSFLSNNDHGLLVGNFIADHISGNDFENLPEHIIAGIKLHRKIDVFTDSHQKFKESKRIFYNGYEKYSGILIDIYFDHLLAKNYSVFSDISLSDYSEKVYDIYSTHQELLPESSKHFLKYVLSNNIYTAYAQKEGIQKVLFHLSHRINHGIQLDRSIDLFINNETQLKNNFEDFFNDALKEFNNNAQHV